MWDQLYLCPPPCWCISCSQNAYSRVVTEQARINQRLEEQGKRLEAVNQTQVLLIQGFIAQNAKINRLIERQETFNRSITQLNAPLNGAPSMLTPIQWLSLLNQNAAAAPKGN